MNDGTRTSYIRWPMKEMNGDCGIEMDSRLEKRHEVGWKRWGRRKRTVSPGPQ